MSGDGIAGRKPYGIVTRMLNIVGMKRIELNRLLRFSNVTESNFPSVLRRSFVWKPQARFLDPLYLANHYPNHERDGVFKKNPRLKDFLASPQAAAAGLRLQHAFEMKFTRDECFNMIEAYAALGGDGGLTERSMRIACGLPPRDRRDDDSAGSAGAMLIDSQPDDVDEVLAGLSAAQMCIVQKLMKDGFDNMTIGMFKYVVLSKECPNDDKETLWHKLRTEKYILPALVVKTRGMEAFFPGVKCSEILSSVIDITPVKHPHSFDETYNVQKLSAYLYDHPSRQANVTILLNFYQEWLQSTVKKKGRKSKTEQNVIEELTSHIDKLNANEKLSDEIIHKITNLENKFGSSASSSSSAVRPSPARKKLSKKTSTTDSASVIPDGLVQSKVEYRYTMGELMRTRLVAIGSAAQNCSRRVNVHLLGHTIDLDIENCSWTILYQLVQRLGARLPDEVKETLARIALKRRDVCNDDLHSNIAVGKDFFTRLLGGSAIPAQWVGNDFVNRLHKAVRWLRWLACTLLPDVHERCRSENRRFPESSTLFFLWTAVEDAILHAWIEFVLQHRVSHLSLHYDGLRISIPLPLEAEDFCKASSDHIFEVTGFRVSIRVKEHISFFALLAKKAKEIKSADLKEDIWYIDGNCIPLALSYILDDHRDILVMIQDQASVS